MDEFTLSGRTEPNRAQRTHGASERRQASGAQAQAGEAPRPGASRKLWGKEEALLVATVTLAARLAGKTAAETISVMLAVFARIEPALRGICAHEERAPAVCAYK